MTAAQNQAAQAATPGPLVGLSVVDLGDGTSAPYAAKLLGDFGAEVVKVEPLEGDSARRRGPFPDGRPDPEASGLFLYLNINKLGAALDPGTAAGQAALDRLLGRADIVVSNWPAERLAAAGAAPAELRRRHPRLVVTTISPFGNDGPWAGRRGDELVTYAMGGIAYSTPGMPDAADDLEGEPPLHPDCFAAETLAGVVAATATLAAVLGRDLSGQGCHVEVSQQAAVAAMQQRDITTCSYLGIPYNRLTNPTFFGRMPNFYVPCKDGYLAFAAPTEHHWERVVEAMGNPAWARAPEFIDVPARAANWAVLRLKLIEWAMTKTGDGLFAIGGKLRVPCCPSYPLRRRVDSPDVAARGSLVPVEVGGRPARMPGPPIGMRGSPWSFRRPAPRLGEHNAALLGAAPGGTP